MQSKKNLLSLLLCFTIFGNAFSQWPETQISRNTGHLQVMQYGDLNGDGFQDVIFATRQLIGSGYTYGLNAISWIPNENTHFGYQKYITMNADSVFDMVVGDLDGDNDMDLVAAHKDTDKIEWYINDGLGNFTTALPISTTADGVYSLSLADLDGDNDLDIIAATHYSSDLGWYENDGSGNFTYRQIAHSHYRIFDQVPVDMNNDNNTDIVIGVKSAQWGALETHWLENDGNGNFTTSNLVFDALGGDVEVIDYQGDNDPDILVMSANDVTRIIINQGNGTFLPSNMPAGYFGMGGNSTYRPSDINGTGKVQDVYQLRNYVGPPPVYPGYIYSQAPVSISVPNNYVDTMAWNNVIIDMRAVDMNNDALGREDCIYGTVHETYVKYHFGNSNYSSRQKISFGGEEPHNVRLGDMNGDGFDDIVATLINEYKVVYYPNDGQNNFYHEVIITDQIQEPEEMEIADMDGDNDLDVVVERQGMPEIYWLENDGSGNFTQNAIGIPTNTTWSMALEVADFDGNNLPDIVLGYDINQRLVLCRNQGSGNFAVAEFFTQGFSNNGIESITSGDIDGDNDIDLVVSGSAMEVNTFFNDGSANFSAPTQISV